ERLGGRKVLEVCAGNGVWACLLANAGACVVATDAASPPFEPYFPLELLDAETAVRQHPECGALLVVWPPFKDGCAFRALRAFAGDLLVYAGDLRFTADERFHALVASEWRLLEEVPLPSWPGTDDAARVYRRGA